jgi:hypothetical protein
MTKSFLEALMNLKELINELEINWSDIVEVIIKSDRYFSYMSKEKQQPLYKVGVLDLLTGTEHRSNRDWEDFITSIKNSNVIDYNCKYGSYSIVLEEKVE